MSVINQKEYLKKYLKIGKAPGEKRKRKKKDKHTINRLKVIDDNIDVVVLNELNDSNNVNEEDPQIVEIIDDRPPSLRIDEKTNSKLWKPIGEAHVERKIKSEPNSDSEHSTLTPKLEKSAKASRKKRLNSDHDISPLRKEKRNNKTSDTDNSPPRKYRGNDKDDDNSPPRRSKKTGTKNAGVHSSRKSSRWDDHDTSVGLFTKELKENVTKTLDGKKAGLQNAADLVTETIKLKQKEHEVFARMADDVSGKNAATVVRRRRRKNQEEDLDEGEIAHKHELEQQNKEKYDRWGRGLKQVENYRERMIQDLHEMSKPLARYADDEDLERHLKEQERDGDPMLAYIRSKKHKEDVQAGLQVKPTYQGSFMPNRYGIAPGYRWDGVDRSNGYDKKWVDAQNARTADQEENYKWSTEDM